MNRIKRPKGKNESTCEIEMIRRMINQSFPLDKKPACTITYTFDKGGERV